MNSDGRFLRGGQPQQSLTFQDDALQDHEHSILDSGHKHLDEGHTHSDDGHAHNYYDAGQYRYDYGYSHGSEQAGSYGSTEYETSEAGKANIQSSNANIKSATSNIAVKKVANARTSDETRPRNVIIQWIIRICWTNK